MSPLCQANFIYGREEAKVRRHGTSMLVLIRPTNNFLGQAIGSVSEGKDNTVNNTTSGEVTFKKCLNLGITYFHLKITSSHKHSPLVPTRAYMNLGHAA